MKLIGFNVGKHTKYGSLGVFRLTLGVRAAVTTGTATHRAVTSATFGTKVSGILLSEFF